MNYCFCASHPFIETQDNCNCPVDIFGILISFWKKKLKTLICADCFWQWAKQAKGFLSSEIPETFLMMLELRNVLFVKLCYLIPSCTAADDQIYVILMRVLKNFAVSLLFTPLFLLDVFRFSLCVRFASLHLPSACKLQLSSVLDWPDNPQTCSRCRTFLVVQHSVTAGHSSRRHWQQLVHLLHRLIASGRMRQRHFHCCINSFETPLRYSVFLTIHYSVPFLQKAASQPSLSAWQKIHNLIPEIIIVSIFLLFVAFAIQRRDDLWFRRPPRRDESSRVDLSPGRK